MTSGKQTVHNFTTIYCGQKIVWPTKKSIHTSNKLTDKKLNSTNDQKQC